MAYVISYIILIVKGDGGVTQKDKLMRKMKNNPRDVGFDDLHKYLTQNGATVRQSGGEPLGFFAAWQPFGDSPKQSGKSDLCKTCI